MDEDGVIGLAFWIVGGVLGLLVVTGVVLYAVDYKIEADVEQTRCAEGEVDVKTKLFGIDHTVKGVPADQCGILEAGNHVEYRIRSQRTTLYESEGGRCIYDSKTGPYCGQAGSSGGLFDVLG